MKSFLLATARLSRLSVLVALGSLLLTVQAQASRHHHHGGGGYSSTVYGDDGLSSNGYTYRQNDRLFKYCVACNRARLGDILELPTRGGGVIRAVNVDHIGHGSDLDMHVRTAHAVVGDLNQGRWNLHPRVVGHIDVMKSHHARHHREASRHRASTRRHARHHAKHHARRHPASRRRHSEAVADRRRRHHHHRHHHHRRHRHHHHR